MNIIGKRLKNFFEHYDISISSVEARIGSSKYSLGRALKNETSFSVELLPKIISEYNINAEWLLTGKGEMLLNPEKLHVENTEIDGGNYAINGQKSMALEPAESNYVNQEKKIRALEDELLEAYRSIHKLGLSYQEVSLKYQQLLEKQQSA